MTLKVGQTVKWAWGAGEGQGKIVNRFEHDVTCQIAGAEVTRNATPETPAFLVEQSDGDQVLKSCSELSPI